MRIGLACTTIEPCLFEGKIDGVGTHTKDLYETYLKMGQDVTPFSFRGGELWTKPSGLPNGQRFLLSYPYSTFASFLPIVPRILYAGIHKKIDIYHTADYMIPNIKSVPVVATFHDALLFKEPSWYVSGKLKDLIKSRTTKWANHFITISQAMVPELVQYLGISEKNISVVHLAISDWWKEPISAEDKEKVLKKFGIPKKFLLCTGTLQPKKNLPRLIEAYLALPKEMKQEHPLIISGKAGWKTEESLAAIQKLEEAKAGKWIKYPSKEELKALYQSATVFLHPSMHEGFGLTLLEGFASKTPVLTSNITAMPEVAGDAAYLIDPYSVNDIKKGMEALLSSETLQQSLVKKGTERLKDFSLEKCAKGTLAVYEKVLSKS